MESVKPNLKINPTLLLSSLIDFLASSIDLSISPFPKALNANK